MEIRIGERVRTRVGSWDKPEWVFATIGEVVTGHKGTVQYRLDYDDGGYDYMVRDEFEIVKNS